MSLRVIGSPWKLTVFTLLLLVSATTLVLLVMKSDNTLQFAQAAGIQKSGNAMPKKEKIKLGVVVQDYSNTQNGVSNLEKQLGTSVSTLSIFKQFGHPHNKYLSQDRLQYAKQNNKKLLIAWEPWNPEEGNQQKIDYLKEIPAGKHDTYIREFAQSLKAHGNPVTLRFGHEMNGGWYPWGKRPQEYIVAYRHIHRIFKEERVTNVDFMWCVNETTKPHELASYYPGNDVVDSIGIDGFNFGTNTSNGKWRSFNDVFGTTYTYLVTNYKKPITIAETGSSEHGGNKASWIQAMFAILPQKFPNVREIIWFNLNKETDWRIESSPNSLKAFQKNLNY